MCLCSSNKYIACGFRLVSTSCYETSLANEIPPGQAEVAPATGRFPSGKL